MHRTTFIDRTVCRLQCLPEHNSDILDSMVIVHLQVAFRRNIQREKTMPGDMGQHMVKKTNSGSEIASAMVARDVTVSPACHSDKAL